MLFSNSGYHHFVREGFLLISPSLYGVCSVLLMEYTKPTNLWITLKTTTNPTLPRQTDAIRQCNSKVASQG